MDLWVNGHIESLTQLPGTWTDWESKGMKKDRHMDMWAHRKAGSGWARIADGKATALWKLNVFIILSWLERQSYCVQLNKEAELLQSHKQGGRVCGLQLDLGDWFI